MLTKRSHSSTAAILEVAYDVHEWEGVLEVEYIHPTLAGDSADMMEEAPVEGRTVLRCCS